VGDTAAGHDDEGDQTFLGITKELRNADRAAGAYPYT
jgi:hypothetical protein